MRRWSWSAIVDSLDLGTGLDHLPTHDIQRFSEACVAIDKARDTTPEMVASIIQRIEPAAGLFLMESASRADRRGHLYP